MLACVTVLPAVTAVDHASGGREGAEQMALAVLHLLPTMSSSMATGCVPMRTPGGAIRVTPTTKPPACDDVFTKTELEMSSADRMSCFLQKTSDMLNELFKNSSRSEEFEMSLVDGMSCFLQKTSDILKELFKNSSRSEKPELLYIINSLNESVDMAKGWLMERENFMRESRADIEMHREISLAEDSETTEYEEENEIQEKKVNVFPRVYSRQELRKLSGADR
ncbi:hypothetical protein PMAYCL1PPCAC_09196 [Pristionchus mayeri]|uniref:Uncharacterized protein n=1 Tax=Pristionchus mayeri TaxID=1317129 RepID=A0AAN4ZDY2_9BILA|nr:hypothetical protein PMAYCL1PPCAC_09196 [Pristionchus mayeri]